MKTININANTLIVPVTHDEKQDSHYFDEDTSVILVDLLEGSTFIPEEMLRIVLNRIGKVKTLDKIHRLDTGEPFGQMVNNMKFKPQTKINYDSKILLYDEKWNNGLIHDTKLKHLIHIQYDGYKGIYFLLDDFHDSSDKEKYEILKNTIDKYNNLVMRKNAGQ